MTKQELCNDLAFWSDNALSAETDTDKERALRHLVLLAQKVIDYFEHYDGDRIIGK